MFGCTSTTPMIKSKNLELIPDTFKVFNFLKVELFKLILTKKEKKKETYTKRKKQTD